MVAAAHGTVKGEVALEHFGAHRHGRDVHGDALVVP